MLEKIFETYKNATKKKKLAIIAGFLMALGLLMTYAIYTIGLLVRVAMQDPTGNPFYYATQTRIGKPFCIIILVIFVFIFIAALFFVDRKNISGKADKRGVHFMEKGTYGTSEWMSEEEAKEVYTVDNVANTTEMIYGQFTDEGEKVVTYKKPTKGATKSQNILCLATTGSGKSWCVSRVQILTAINKGSFVCTDPSSELYTDLSNYCKSKGMDVKVLNLAEPKYSNCWNCIRETIDPETERLDDTRLNDFVTIYMQNTGNGIEDFWYLSAVNLIKSIIGFTSYEQEIEIIDGYARFYKDIRKEDKGFEFDNDPFRIKITNDFVSFVEVRNILKYTALEHGWKEEDIENRFKEIKKHAEDKCPFTLEQVYLNMLNFEGEKGTKVRMKGSEESKIWPWHPAAQAYKMYNSNDSQNVRQSALQGALFRFQLFTDSKVKRMLSNDGITLSDINKKKSAYFVIMSDKSTATKPIASLFFSFLFKDAQDNYDKEQQLSKEESRENSCLPVSAILDEFFSIGVLQGSPEAFGVTMANCRKRQINITIIIQVYSQLEALYGPKIKDVIQGGCQTLLYLGGNDPETCRFVSEFASGEATVLNESHEELSNPLSTAMIKPGYRSTSDKRFLLTVDEARRWKDKVLVVTQGEHPLELNPFPWTQHPAYKDEECKPVSIYSTIPPISSGLTLDILNGKPIKGVAKSSTDKKASEEPEMLKDSDFVETSSNEKEVVVSEGPINPNSKKYSIKKKGKGHQKKPSQPVNELEM